MRDPSEFLNLPVRSLTRLEELAHELSNSMGITLNSLAMVNTDEAERILTHLETANEQAMRATGTLQILMWELAALRRSAQAGTDSSGRCD